MKYFVGAIVAILVLIAIRNASFKSPNGTYADPNRAIVMTFEPSGRLSIAVRAASSIMLNNREWNGPAANRVTVTTWERRGGRIYIAIPGEKEPIPAIKIDGNDLLMDNLRLSPTRL